MLNVAQWHKTTHNNHMTNIVNTDNMLITDNYTILYRIQGFF